MKFLKLSNADGSIDLVNLDSVVAIFEAPRSSGLIIFSLIGGKNYEYKASSSLMAQEFIKGIFDENSHI